MDTWRNLRFSYNCNFGAWQAGSACDTLRATMPIRINTRLRVETAQTARPRGKALLAATALLAMALILLWLDRGFGVYAATGLFWNEAPGAVVDASRSSVPVIEFATPDGATHRFREDYIQTCRNSRKFCFVRSFQLGEQVPVVYSPRNPERAYVHDWALYASVLGFFLELVLAFFMVLMAMVAVRRRPMEESVEFSSSGTDPWREDA